MPKMHDIGKDKTSKLIIVYIEYKIKSSYYEKI